MVGVVLLPLFKLTDTLIRIVSEWWTITCLLGKSCVLYGMMFCDTDKVGSSSLSLWQRP